MSISEHDKLYLPSHWSKRFNTPEELLDYYFKFCQEQTDRARETVAHELDIPYSDSKNTKYDIYGTNLPKDAPILLFIHGGYWQEFSKDLSGFMVPNFVSHGIKVILAGYDLCPNVTLTQIVEQIQVLVKRILLLAKEVGTKSVWIVGHSAGAHLAASLLHNQKWLHQLRENGAYKLLHGLILIAGIYNLKPLQTTSMNEALQLTDNEIQQYSFVHGLQNNIETTNYLDHAKIIITVSENDSKVFCKESMQYAKKLINDLCRVEFLFIRDDIDHFNIVENFIKSDYYLFKLLIKDIMFSSNNLK